MISRAEIRYALRGLIDILRFNPGFLQFYDRSLAGARRSFQIYVFLLALQTLQTIVFQGPQDPPLTARMWTALTIARIINVVYFPLILLLIGRFIDREKRIVGCIAVYNWLNLLSILLSIPVTLIALAGVDASVLQLCSIVTLFVGLICEGYVLAICLGISPAFAAAFVALDLVIGEILFHLADAMGQHAFF